MSSRTILSRPRTRVYDANYNIGESYYKSAIDRLDRKYSGRPLTPPREREPSTLAADIAERHAAAFADEDISASRRRADKLINEDNIFDSRSGRIGRRPFDDDNDVDDEVCYLLLTLFVVIDGFSDFSGTKEDQGQQKGVDNRRLGSREHLQQLEDLPHAG